MIGHFPTEASVIATNLLFPDINILGVLQEGGKASAELCNMGRDCCLVE